ncbi:hypothetical protein BV20DRAFT_730079 [Pilatotrama ljubarskyi]|nr:hypothetical protein BV20DRAFT_730079 [Pilatotrama ljubarskyi]
MKISDQVHSREILRATRSCRPLIRKLPIYCMYARLQRRRAGPYAPVACPLCSGVVEPDRERLRSRHRFQHSGQPTYTDPHFVDAFSHGCYRNVRGDGAGEDSTVRGATVGDRSAPPDDERAPLQSDGIPERRSGPRPREGGVRHCMSSGMSPGEMVTSGMLSELIRQHLRKHRPGKGAPGARRRRLWTLEHALESWNVCIQRVRAIALGPQGDGTHSSGQSCWLEKGETAWELCQIQMP